MKTFYTLSIAAAKANQKLHAINMKFNYEIQFILKTSVFFINIRFCPVHLFTFLPMVSLFVYFSRFLGFDVFTDGLVLFLCLVRGKGLTGCPLSGLSL